MSKKRQKIEKIDGFGPAERKRVTAAMRQVWYQSRSRNIVKAQCVDKQGFPWCPKCKQRVPKIEIDHITPVGAIDSDGALLRMFCPSKRLRGLCHECHLLVTERGKPPGKRKKVQFWDL